MPYELNLRLDVRGEAVTPDLIEAQLALALNALRRLGPCEYRQEASGAVGEYGGTRLLARVHADIWDRQAMHALAVALRQDCLAVYDPILRYGALLGPCPEAYLGGHFDVASFRRFDGAQMPVAPADLQDNARAEKSEAPVDHG